MSKQNAPCIPALMKRAQGGKKVGDRCGKSGGMRQARLALIERDGPAPFERALCRHLCDNDSQAPDGFVCIEHTEWGSYSDNEMDKDPEVRKQRSSAGGKSPSTASQRQVTCPHCGKAGQQMAMMRCHFDRCKSRS